MRDVHYQQIGLHHQEDGTKVLMKLAEMRGLGHIMEIALYSRRFMRLATIRLMFHIFSYSNVTNILLT